MSHQHVTAAERDRAIEGTLASIRHQLERASAWTADIHTRDSDEGDEAGANRAEPTGLVTITLELDCRAALEAERLARALAPDG